MKGKEASKVAISRQIGLLCMQIRSRLSRSRSAVATLSDEMELERLRKGLLTLNANGNARRDIQHYKLHTV